MEQAAGVGIGQLREAARLGAQQFEQAVAGVVQHAAGIGPQLGGHLVAQPQAQRPRLLHHPLQGAVRQAGLRIAAADIAVDAGKPELLDARAVLDAGPQRGREAEPAFVQGDGVAGVVDARIERGVVEGVAARIVDQVEDRQVVGDAERAHGVPGAQKVHRDRLASGIGLVEGPVLGPGAALLAGAVALS